MTNDQRNAMAGSADEPKAEITEMTPETVENYLDKIREILLGKKELSLVISMQESEEQTENGKVFDVWSFITGDIPPMSAGIKSMMKHSPGFVSVVKAVLAEHAGLVYRDENTKPGPTFWIEHIAKTCHEVNKAYCESLGDFSQPDWESAEDWQKNSAMNGVQFHLSNPDSKPSDSHENWMKEKVADGWKYGPVKNPETKEHPCIVPYEELPKEQQTKDALFIAVVRSFEK